MGAGSTNLASTNSVGNPTSVQGLNQNLDSLNGGFMSASTNNNNNNIIPPNSAGSQNPSGFQTMSSIAQQKRKISIGNRGALIQQQQQMQ